MNVDFYFSVTKQMLKMGLNLTYAKCLYNVDSFLASQAQYCKYQHFFSYILNRKKM